MNPQAKALKDVLEGQNPGIFSLLSTKGKNIFYPKEGLLKQGEDAKSKTINASVGMAFEEDGTPVHLQSLEALVNMPQAKVYPYSSSYGQMPLRKKWQSMMREKNPLLKDTEISLPVVTNALTHGLTVAGYLFMDEGEKVILPDLYWKNYNLLFAHARGGELDTFPMFQKENFNLEGLREKLLSKGKKKILILNFPNNPTGYSPKVTEVQGIRKILLEAAEAGKTIVLITDDAYFGLDYEDDVEKESVFAHAAALHENILAVKIDGATKEDYAWGFRIGFITFAWKGMTSQAAAAMADKAGAVVRGSISNASTPAQSFLLAAYEDPGYWKDKKAKFELLQARYRRVKETLKAHEEYRQYFEPVPYNAGYFMCVRLKKGNAEEVRQKLLADYDTGVISLGDLIRVAYSSLPQKYIETLYSNIFKACRDLDQT